MSGRALRDDPEALGRAIGAGIRDQFRRRSTWLPPLECCRSRGSDRTSPDVGPGEGAAGAGLLCAGAHGPQALILGHQHQACGNFRRHAGVGRARHRRSDVIGLPPAAPAVKVPSLPPPNPVRGRPERARCTPTSGVPAANPAGQPGRDSGGKKVRPFLGWSEMWPRGNRPGWLRADVILGRRPDGWPNPRVTGSAVAVRPLGDADGAPVSSLVRS